MRKILSFIMTVAIAVGGVFSLTKADALSAVVHSTVNFVDYGYYPYERILLSKGDSVWLENELILDPVTVAIYNNPLTVKTDVQDVKDSGLNGFAFYARYATSEKYAYSPEKYLNMDLRINNNSEYSHNTKISISELIYEGDTYIEKRSVIENVTLADLASTVVPQIRLSTNTQKKTVVLVHFVEFNNMPENTMNLDVNLTIAGDQK